MCVVGQKEQHNNGTTKKQQQRIHGKKRRWWKREREWRRIYVYPSVWGIEKDGQADRIWWAIVCAAVPPQNQYEFIISWLKDREPQRPGPITRHFIRLQFFFSRMKLICQNDLLLMGAGSYTPNTLNFSFVFLWPPSLCFLCFFLFCCYFSITELYIEMFLSLAQL